MRRALFAVWLGCCALSVQAGLGPHEVAVLVNRRSPRSMEVANHFIQLRRVPPQNVIYLDLPDRVFEPAAEISPKEFTETIWTPAQKVLAERGLDHILAWVYSVDFPVRITTQPPVSLMGMTFMRNQFPADPEDVDKGRYLSRLFAGPDSAEGSMALGGSLIRYREELGADQMPLPSMMLGFVGARGTDVDTTLRTLRYGQAADASAPRGTIYWMTGSDIRSQIREWQFPIAQKELTALKVRSEISATFPAQKPDLMGLQLGLQSLHMHYLSPPLPGAMTEHLTSHAASFHLPYQTKLTDWLRAGATASAGTVTEPYSIWTKFPHARFFAHYARGHTMLESFYLSLRSPTQILLVGEPLCRPWAPRLMLTLIALEDGPLKGSTTFYADIAPVVPGLHIDIRFFLDGHPLAPASKDNMIKIDTLQVADGHHRLRAVTYARGLIVQSVYGLNEFDVQNRGRAARIIGPTEPAEIDPFSPLTLTVEADGGPDRMDLVHNKRVLGEVSGGEGAIDIDALALGAGPVQLQAVARYADGMSVYSAPLALTVQRAYPTPAIRALRAARDARDGWTWPTWDTADLNGGTAADRGEKGTLYTPVATNTPSVALFPDSVDDWGALSARITIPATRAAHPKNERAGVVFEFKDARNYRFFTLYGESSAWVFGRCRDGRLTYETQRGALILLGTRHEIELVSSEAGVTAYVNGEPIAVSPDPAQPGRLGVLAQHQPIQVEGFCYSTHRIEE